MRFRFQKRRHLTLEVGTGDILTETGNILIAGRISSASPLAELIRECPREEMEKLLLKPTLHFRCENGAWRHVFSIQWTARARSTADSPSYHGAMMALQQIVHYSAGAGLLTGRVRVGMTPFSWRSPGLTAQLMRECLLNLFVYVRNYSRATTSLHVSVRSLGEFRGLGDLLAQDLPVKYGALGLPLTPWVPDESELATA